MYKENGKLFRKEKETKIVIDIFFINKEVGEKILESCYTLTDVSIENDKSYVRKIGKYLVCYLL